MFFTIVCTSDHHLLITSSDCNPSESVLRSYYLQWKQTNTVKRVSGKLLKPFCWFMKAADMK